MKPKLFQSYDAGFAVLQQKPSKTAVRKLGGLVRVGVDEPLLNKPNPLSTPASSTPLKKSSFGQSEKPTTAYYVYSALATASFAASVFHGYRRNNGSIGWAIGWGALGALFPVITPVIAVAQGFGKPAK